MPLYRFCVAALAAVVVSEAFVTPSTRSSRPVSSSLSALPPPMIIGPMIKKMREEKQKKKMPMADALEAAKQAPGLRVGQNAWKWPPVWPYDASFFMPSAQAAAQAQQDQMKNMASMFTGVAQVPTESDLAISEENKFDPIQYWGQEQASTMTELDPDAIEKLKEHYSYYLQDGMSILEFGAAEDSYLPDNIKPGRHVGVGANAELMKQNPSLTESMVVDLNKVVENRDVDSDDLRRLASEQFDAVIMANTVDYLTNPREVFRTAWYLLKPGGIMLVSFASKEATKDKFTEAQTKMWLDYNDDQHMWITGSFFQFSAGDGWESLLGFDISPDSAKEIDDNPLAGILNRGKANNMYVVQAVKGVQDEGINPDDLERSIRSLTWMLPTMEERDKSLVVPRLARACELAESDDIISAVERNIQYLPAIYEALIKMDQFAFTFSMQSQMAADLVCNPDFTGSEEEIMALKQGLGLRTPSPEFWAPIGENTAAMGVEDKINLLAYIVPCFGATSNPAQEEALEAFVSGLKPTYAVIRSKCPEMSESDVQLLGTELLAAEVLKPGRSTREEFATWLAALSDAELREFLAERKAVQEKAKTELNAYKEAREEKKRERAEYERLMNEQIEKARKERSLIFNPKTQKMEIFNPKK